jgi:hypothetical protein
MNVAEAAACLRVATLRVLKAPLDGV